MTEEFEMHEHEAVSPFFRMYNADVNTLLLVNAVDHSQQKTVPVLTVHCFDPDDTPVPDPDHPENDPHRPCLRVNFLMPALIGAKRLRDQLTEYLEMYKEELAEQEAEFQDWQDKHDQLETFINGVGDEVLAEEDKGTSDAD